MERVLGALQEVCVEAKAIDLTGLAVDGFFSSGKGGGVTSHLIVDGLGPPLAVTSTGAAGDKRKEVIDMT